MEELGHGSCELDFAALVAAFGADVDDVVGSGDDVEVVFDDDDGASVVDHLVEQAQQLIGVLGVQPCGGFVEDDEIGVSNKFAGEFEPLALTAGEGGEILA